MNPIDAGDILLVPLERLAALVCLIKVPQPDIEICARRRQRRTFAVESDIIDSSRVSLERPFELSRLIVPNRDRGVFGARHQDREDGMEYDARDRAAMSAELHLVWRPGDESISFSSRTTRRAGLRVLELFLELFDLCLELHGALLEADDSRPLLLENVAAGAKLDARLISDGTRRSLEAIFPQVVSDCHVEV